MSSFLLYGAVAGCICGVFSRTLLQFGLVEISWILVVSFALALVWRRQYGSSFSSYGACVSIFLLCFACGALRMDYAVNNATHPTLEALLGTTVQGEGVIVREPEAKARSLHAYVKSGDELYLVTTEPGTPLAYGDAVSFIGVLEKPEAFETEFGRVFDYPGYMRARGVEYMVSFAEVEVTQSDQGNPMLSSLLTLKHAFMEKLELVLPSPHVGLAEGLLLGVKRALGETYEDAFRATGITHIVVLSGYNIMLVMVFILFVLSFFLPYRLRLACGMGAIAAFALLVGLSATVVRASFMAGLMLVAQVTGRTYDVVRALMITGVAMLLFNPHLLVFDVGFQLSFAATLGLILLSAPLEARVRFMPNVIGLRGFLVATLSAQIFVLPLLLYQIGQFSLVSVVVNLLVLPMVPVAMLLSFLAGSIGFVSVQASVVVGYAAYWSLEYILFVASFFASLPFASVVVPAFPFVVVVGLYTVMALALFVYMRTDARAEDPLASWTIVDEARLTKTRNTEVTPVFFR